MAEHNDTIVDRVLQNTPSVLAGFAVMAAIAAFTVQPLLRFADPAALFSGTILMFGGVANARSAATEDRATWLRHGSFWVGALMILTGLGFVIATLISAQRSASANDTRCMAIQREMLVAKPRRADLPDLFAALGCRPQGIADPLQI